MAYNDTNYVCEIGTWRALRGPWSTKKVVEFIDANPERAKLSNMSRYMLAKVQAYPHGKAGDAALVADIKKAGGA